MIWSSFFIISIAQALFLISLILIRKSSNPAASGLIVILLCVMILPNLDLLFVSSGIYKNFPHLFGISFGTIFLFGPLFYFYTKSTTDSSFSWNWVYLLHFVPYILNQVINSELHLLDKQTKIFIIDCFLTRSLPIRLIDYIIFIIQDIHLFIYLLLSLRQIKSLKINNNKASYIISIAEREKWLKQIFSCFSFFLLFVFSYLAVTLIDRHYNPTANYLYTLIISITIYLIAYKSALNPELISPDFSLKYKTYMNFNGLDGEKYIQKLKLLMEQDKIYTNPELKLTTLSEMIGLPAHQLSKLINEKFSKSFKDYINDYRVNEFIKKINTPEHQSMSIYGIALESGFNSKSSFNTSFKKATGKNPSDFKKPI